MHTVCLLLALAAPDPTITITALPPGRNLLPNPAFTAVTDGVPTGWRWSRGRADCDLTIVSPGHSGPHAVRLRNRTPLEPHVYGQLTVGNVTVKPHTRYTLSFWARTPHPPGHAWVGGGPGWSWRLSVPDTGGRWLRVSGSFTTGDDTSIPFMLNTDSVTDGYDLADVQLEAGGLSPFEDPAGVPAAALDLSPATRPASWMPELYPPERYAFAATALTLAGSLGLPQPVAGARVEVALRHGEQVLATARSTGELPTRGSVAVSWPLPADCPTDLELTARLTGVTPAVDLRQPLTLVHAAAIEQLLATTEARLPALETKAASDDDARCSATTARWFLGWTRADLRANQLDRAYDTARRLVTLVDTALAAPTRARVPRYVTSPLTPGGAAATGDTLLPDGTRARQPVWFVGWGHFGEVRRRVEEFPAVGANILQVEFGPKDVLTAENTVSDRPIQEFRALAARAAAANVQINLLLSPHYFPAWALRKWPDLKNFSGGFLTYSLYDERAKGVLEQFLRYTVPRLRDLPALHSLCLSNEPLCLDQSACPPAQALWRGWLKQQFGTVAAVNARWGTTYADFAAVPIPSAKWTPTVLTYDYSRFNSEAFAAWHGWMAGIVHELAPALPVHAKIMMSNHFGPDLGGPWSIAPERFAAVSDLLGNDCCKWPEPVNEFACQWQTENMAYDYQRSLADQPVFNSENHLIQDRNLHYVSPAYIRNVYWQGAVHGQGATTTWVLERTNDANSDFAGSLAHRPDCLESVGLTALDLGRAAREVAALANDPAPVGLLWSHASLVLGPRYENAVKTAYQAANFCDVGVGFVNEHDCEVYAAGEPNRALDRTRLLLVPGARQVPQAVMAALRRFTERGGRVLCLGEALVSDELGAAYPAHGYETWPLGTPRELQARLLAQVPAPRLKCGVWGVEARSAALDGRTVVNLCNYLRDSARVTLPPGTVDRLSGERLGTTLELAPLAPRLVVLGDPR